MTRTASSGLDLALCVALALAPGCAQDAPRAARALDSRETSLDPGNAAPIAEYVLAALEDSRGQLWFGTNGQGVARYDPSSAVGSAGGLSYVSIDDGLIGDVVTDIVEDRAGCLWFGTHTGASRFDPAAVKSGGGTGFTGFGSEAGLRGGGCKLLVDRNGTLWAGTDEGAFRFDGARFAAFDLPTPRLSRVSYKVVPGKVWDLFEDSQGNLWFARDGYGACRYQPSAALLGDGSQFTLFTQEDGLCSNNVASIVEDGRGELWFGSITTDHPQYVEEGGVSRYSPSAARETGKPAFTRFPGIKGLTANDVYNLYSDRSGCVWIAAVRVGVYRFDPAAAGAPGGQPFTLFDRTDRPDLTWSLSVQAFEQDRHGTLWFGFSGGLFRLQGTSFVHVTRAGPWISPWSPADESTEER